MNHRRDKNGGSQALCDPPLAASKATTRASPLRYYGGLQSFSQKLTKMLPPHDVYIEPFAGGLSVLLVKPQSDTEYVSDIHPDLINYWQMVQRHGSRRRLIEMIEMTAYSRETFRGCVNLLEEGGGTPLLRAWAMAVAHNQSRNGLGVDWSYGKSFSNQNANSWAKLTARIELAGRRLRHVRIECLPYEETLQRCNTKTVLFLDPPYLPSTRVSAKVYLHEFDRKMHQGLLDTVRRLRKPKVILCGYRDGLIEDALDGWRRTDIKTKSFAAPRAKGRKLPDRVLSVYTNYEPPSS